MEKATLIFHPHNHPESLFCLQGHISQDFVFLVKLSLKIECARSVLIQLSRSCGSRPFSRIDRRMISVRTIAATGRLPSQ